MTCLDNGVQGTKIFQYCSCPAGRVTYNIHLSCKHMHLSFKSICNKEHEGVICNMTSSRNTRPFSISLVITSGFFVLECNVKANTYYGGGGLILQDLGSS